MSFNPITCLCHFLLAPRMISNLIVLISLILILEVIIFYINYYIITTLTKAYSLPRNQSAIVFKF